MTLRSSGLILLILVAFNYLTAQAPSLNGVRVCLDPGHGGQDADDRPTDLGIDTIYYESNANWDAVLQLEELLQSFGAIVKLTKTTNDPGDPARDPSLADRVQVANAFGADYFHSFHTNGFTNPETNYSLVLYPGPEDGMADFPESIEMAEIMSQEFLKYVRTTATFARADIPFTGFMNGLGVLNNLSMPGTLSEVSFHSNLNEGRRLMNTDYRRAAAWAITKSFLQYYSEPLPETGELGGIVTDLNGTALNGIEIILSDSSQNEVSYIGDQFLNGFYFFDSLTAGDYEVLISKVGYESQQKTISILPGEYTELDASLTIIGGVPNSPELISVLSYNNNGGLKAEWVKNPEVSLFGYRLYYATEDELENWVLAADEQTIGPESTTVTISSYDDFLVKPGKDIHHFKLTAIAESGAESGSSDIYSRQHGEGSQSVLIVDGFDRFSGSYGERIHSFSADYQVALRKSNTSSISSISNEGVISMPALLDSYNLVLWYLGDESTADETLTSKEQEILSQYLQQGGKLLITGAEIGWDLDNRGSASDRSFYREMLKAKYEGDGAPNYTPAQGINATLFEDIIVNFGITYQEDFPDEMSEQGGSEALLTYNSPGGIAAVGFKGLFPDGQQNGALINIGFALETASRQDMEDLLRQCLAYLEVGSIISSNDDILLNSTSSFEIKITPNPSSTNATVSLLAKNELLARRISVTVFNSLGGLQYHSDVDPSKLEFELPSSQWPTGNYFIKITHGKESTATIFTKIN